MSSYDSSRPAHCGRFAPSPSGLLHAGSLLAALASWLDAEHHGGTWLVRVEDIDPPREKPGAARDILAELQRLGLHAHGRPLFQSSRLPAYEEALQTLLALDLAYPCWCSRSQLAASGGLHHGRCRPPADAGTRSPAIRLSVDGQTVSFEDRIQGAFVQRLDEEVGDFVLRRADGLPAYQLAVVVDDAFQGITDVVRGADLLDSTPRQILLQRLLGLPTPRYAHIPLLLDESGRKLAKSAGSAATSAQSPQQALAEAARLLGQDPRPVGSDLHAWLHEQARDWSIGKVPRGPLRLSPHIA